MKEPFSSLLLWSKQRSKAALLSPGPNISIQGNIESLMAATIFHGKLPDDIELLMKNTVITALVYGDPRRGY